MLQPPLLGVGPDGLRWTRTRAQRALLVGMDVAFLVLLIAFAIATMALNAPLAALSSVPFILHRAVVLLSAISAAIAPAVVEVGPDGVWLPELGYRRWTDFSSIRVEAYEAAEAGRRRKEPGAARRRLGFQLRPDGDQGRGSRIARLEAGMRLGWYALVARVAGVKQPAIARYGISEEDLGTETFDEVVAAVAREVPLWEDEAVAEPEPVGLVSIHSMGTERQKLNRIWVLFGVFVLVIIGIVVFSRPEPIIVPVFVTPGPAVSPSGS